MENKFVIQMREYCDKLFPDITDNTPDNITVKNLDDLVKSIFDADKLIDEAQAVVSDLNKKLAVLKARGVRYLKALEKEDYKSEFGNIKISQKWRVNLPQTPEDKLAFFEYLRTQGLFDKFATVNSMTLNSYYMSEWEAAQKNGKGISFSIPGIGERKMFEDLGIRKSKESSDE